jgi:hypothetical protein
VLAKRELGGDLLVRHAGRDEAQDLGLAGREPSCRGGVVQELGDTARIPLGVELFERGARGAKLESRALLVASGAARFAE